MKRLTLHIEMRCNSYCIFCGTRAIDPAMVKVRRELGLSVPAPPGAPADYEARHAEHVRARASLPVVRGAAFPAFTLESAVATLERAREDGVHALNLQGGEPTLWPEILALVARARGLGFDQITLVTNGRKLANRDFARGLLDAGVTTVVVSLIGHDAATHDGLSRVPGSFDELVQGVRHCVELSAGRAPRPSVWANIITSAETIEHLPAQVDLLAGLGVEAGTLHLVRYEFFADDPAVRARLSFPLERARAPLARAFELAAERGFALLAEDVPLCLHPTLAHRQAQAAVERAEADARQFMGPLAQFPGKNRVPGAPAACDGCVYAPVCARAPAEYLPNGPDGVFRPVTPDTLRAQIERERGPRAQVASMADAVALLSAKGLLDADDTARLVGSLRAAFARSVARAEARGDEPEALASLLGMFGLRPYRTYAGGDLLARARALAPRLEQLRERQLAGGRGAHALRLVFAPGYEVEVLGARTDAETVAVRALRPLVPPADAAGGPIVRALFALHAADKFRDARSVRCTEAAVEVDQGGGYAVAFSRATPWSVAWAE